MNRIESMVEHLWRLIALMAVSGWVLADCPSQTEMAALAVQIRAGEPVEVERLGVISKEDGHCAQQHLVAALRPHWGEPVGYKVGLTSAAVQARFGVHEPVSGRLFADGLLADGVRLPAHWGAHPRIEADLLVEVGDQAIHQARTEAEVLAHLSVLYPFIELPDLVVADPDRLTAAHILAINVGARYGVLGAPLPVASLGTTHADQLNALAEMQVEARDQTGRVLLSAPGRAILGHPLRSVLWLLAQGERFQPGDLISLGAFGPLLTPQPGMRVTVSYRGLPGDPTVSVGFESQ
jgi:2-oxo-hept-3-ene-1,7-dioate hydratase